MLTPALQNKPRYGWIVHAGDGSAGAGIFVPGANDPQPVADNLENQGAEGVHIVAVYQ